MIVLKIVSLAYIAILLLYFVCCDCNTKDTSESIGFKILSLLQSCALVYIIMN
jgi:hypothetical protein